MDHISKWWVLSPATHNCMSYKHVAHEPCFHIITTYICCAHKRMNASHIGEREKVAWPYTVQRSRVHKKCEKPVPTNAQQNPGYSIPHMGHALHKRTQMMRISGLNGASQLSNGPQWSREKKKIFCWKVSKLKTHLW